MNDTMIRLGQFFEWTDHYDSVRIGRVIHAVAKNWDLVRMFDIQILKETDEWLGCLEVVFPNKDLADARYTIQNAVSKLAID